MLSEGYCANMQSFAAKMLGITSTAEAVIELKKMQWIWDRQKTKAGTEGRSLHELLYETVGKLKEAIKGAIHEGEWRRAGKHFGQKQEELSRMVEAFDLGVDIQELPRTYREIDHRLERRDEPHRIMDTTRGSEDMGDRHDERKEDASRVTKAEEAIAKEDEKNARRFLASPRREGPELQHVEEWDGTR